MMRILLLCLCLIPALSSQWLWAQDLLGQKQSSSLSAASTYNEPEFLPVDDAYIFDLSLKPETLRLHWFIEEGYYLYQHSIKVELDGQAIKNLQPPKGIARHDEYFGDVEVYYQQLEILLPLEKQASLITLSYQGCADAGLCYAPRDRFFSIDPEGNISELEEAPANNTNAATAPSKQNISSEAPANSTNSLWLALLFALLGGLILNIMPCVFPVLGLKLLALAESGHKQQHAWVYTAGVISSFLAFALLLAALKSGGEQLGWGFQLQSPVFLWFLAYLFTVLGLNMSGLVYFGSRLMGIGDGLSQQKGIKGDFFTGVLAVVVASPCSVPFMGAALGYTLTQPIPVTLLVFAFLGLGMALPFILVAYLPVLQKLLPKPGVWMEHFKQLLAFPLYLTVAWLLWVLGRQTDVSTLAIALLGCILLGLVCYLLRFKHKLVRLMVVAAIALLAYLPFAPINAEQHHWQAWSAEKVDAALQAGQPVFINATADWCITCLGNELTVLGRDSVLEHFKQQDVLLLKADWTRQDPAISELLNQHQRNGVPLYLWYGPGQQQARVLPQILTEAMILDLQ